MPVVLCVSPLVCCLCIIHFQRSIGHIAYLALEVAKFNLFLKILPFLLESEAKTTEASSLSRQLKQSGTVVMFPAARMRRLRSKPSGL